MTTLPHDASLEEIEDEIMLTQALLDSLGEDVSDNDEQKQQLEAVIESLEARLRDPDTPQTSNEDDNETKDDERAGLMLGGCFDGPADEIPSATSSAPLAASLKRSLYDFRTDGPPSKRHTPNFSRPGTPSSVDSVDLTERNALGGGSFRDRARERQIRAEAALRRRREVEESDQKLAASLVGTASPRQATAGPSYSHDPSSAAPPNPIAPIFTPGFGRRPKPEPQPDSSLQMLSLASPFTGVGSSSSQRHPIKTDPGRSNLPSRSPPGAWPDVVDLTGERSDDDDDDVQFVSDNTPAQARLPQPSLLAPEDQARLAAIQTWQRLRAQVPGQPPAPGFVYGGHGPNQAMQIPAARSIYAAPDPLAPRHLSHFNALASSARDAALNTMNGLGRTLTGWGNELEKVNSLINGNGRDLHEEDDDVVYAGQRSIYQDLRPEEVIEDLKKLMENIRPDEEIPADQEDVPVEGMTVRLKPYQGTGLTWLQKMEDGSNKGSILADDMGLGKTVQAIALMLTRKSDDPLCKTTLILAPVALLRQWKEEIENKVRKGRHALSVWIQHGQARKSYADLRCFDVVITTFGTVAAEYKKIERWDQRKRADPGAVRRADEKTIFLDYDSNWYRIIIDEAQCIKNKNTKTAKAVHLVQAQRRLCMTGTPMMNSVDELFSLIKFLRIKPYNDWTRFNNDFAKPLKKSNDGLRGSAMNKLQVMLKAILLRRNKQSKINGQPILVLPERSVELTHPVFSDEEKDFYKALETTTRITFNKYVRAGTVGRSYAHILVLLLRLRQACCHPHLIKDFCVSAAADITPDAMIELASKLEPDVVVRIMAHEGVFECPVCYDAVENPAIFIPCGHETCSDCFSKIADPAEAVAQGEDGSRNAKCPNCRGPINSKTVIDYETFKKVHMPVPEEPEQLPLAPDDAETESEDDATESDSDSEGDDDSDDTDSLGGFIVDDDAGEDAETESEDEHVKAEVMAEVKTEVKGEDDSDEGDARPSRSSKAKGKMPMVDVKAKKGKKSKSKKSSKSKSSKGDDTKREKKPKKKGPQKTLAELKKLSGRNKAAKKEYLEFLRRDWTGSAKIDKTLELLAQIVGETDEKIIIFSQWTSLLDLLEVPIDERGWAYRRYDGSMNAGMRADAVDDFKRPGGRVRMMLVSLKAGNAGLNLNCASQVIILDPFWNPFVEEQAIDRAHRLGQTRPVKVHRILVEETVEDRIRALQDKKRDLINEALDEGAGQRASRLSPQELAYLFGVTRTPAQPLPAAG